MAGAASTVQNGIPDAFADGSYDPAIADAVNQLEAAAGIHPPVTAVTTPLGQTCDDGLVTTTLLLTTATVQVTLISLVAGTKVTNINVNSGAASSTATHAWAAITTAGSTVSGTVLAVSSDLGTTNTNANAVQAFTLGSVWTVPTTGNYYVHVVQVATGTVMTLDAFAATAGVRATQFPIIAGTGATSVTTPPTVGSTLKTALTATKGIAVWLN